MCSQRLTLSVACAVKSLEKAKYTGNFAAMSSAAEGAQLDGDFVSDSEEDGDADDEEVEETLQARRKRMKS